MDGRGHYMDNIFIERLWKSVKYECVYLHAFTGGITLGAGLRDWFKWYNTERLHQTLDYLIPDQSIAARQCNHLHVNENSNEKTDEQPIAFLARKGER